MRYIFVCEQPICIFFVRSKVTHYVQRLLITHKSMTECHVCHNNINLTALTLTVKNLLGNYLGKELCCIKDGSKNLTYIFYGKKPKFKIFNQKKND